VSAVVTILYLIRSLMPNMKYFIRLEHFDALGKLILVFSLTWAYFFFNDYILSWYGGDQALRDLISFHASGPEAWVWYTMLICNVVIPVLTLWNKHLRRTPWAIFIVTLLVNVGMYAERLTIIPLTLSHGRSPFDWGELSIHYADVALPAGTLCFFIFLYLVASRFIPLVPVWEVQEGQEAHILRQVGKTKVPSVAELE